MPNQLPCICNESVQFLLKVSSVPTLPELKLACWNQFQDKDDVVLPSSFKISITDNSKKKTIALVKNDSQLSKIQCIGYLCEKEVSEQKCCKLRGENVNYRLILLVWRGWDISYMYVAR